ncbi:hypothetical protein P8452_47307 [Trifolium repens]|nr:hypothetical protein QL285_075736 [Trifolium repens]KAK2374799.1 hypothetical protein QL285_075737 [Trifolium repens]WJX62296.1 hypothetical protein P8452_47306 [Trifolium repens]WJX62298.1 hypothetical protein P8452_47307 [Trifolium repens]
MDVKDGAQNVEMEDIEDESSEGNNSWDIIVSKATYIFPTVLHIRRQIAQDCLKTNQELITLVHEKEDKLYPCQMYYYKSHDITMTYIEEGFYEFVHDADVKEGDMLRLTVSIPPDFIDVIVMRPDIV